MMGTPETLDNLEKTAVSSGKPPEQQAVIEVVFNRVYSPLFLDTVHDVLSQKNKNIAQFSTWRNRDSNEATPSTQVIANISEVLEGKTDILPFNTLYFSQKGENVKVQVTIGNHVFLMSALLSILLQCKG